MHHGVIDSFVEQARKMGKDVTVVTEDDITPDTEIAVDDADLVVSMGGDHTFLRA